MINNSILAKLKRIVAAVKGAISVITCFVAPNAPPQNKGTSNSKK
jgi:hypothetical protein